jgi:hypothetical protein
MVIVMKPGASAAETAAVISKAEAVGVNTHPIHGKEHTVIALIGDLD